MLEFVGFAILVLIFWIWQKSRPSRFPPGPLCLPIVGNGHNLSLNHLFFGQMEKLHSKYGPLISLSVAGDQIWDVWFRDYEIAKEVWNDPRFSSRSIVPLAAKLELERGVSFTSGADSRSKRTMLFKVFKALGVFDKSVFSVGVEKEVELMMNYLDTMTEKNLFIQVKLRIT